MMRLRRLDFRHIVTKKNEAIASFFFYPSRLGGLVCNRRAGGAGDWLEEDMIDDKKIKNNSDYRLLSNHYRV